MWRKGMRIKADKRFPLSGGDCDFVHDCEEAGIPRLCYTCTGFYICSLRKPENCNDRVEQKDFKDKIEKHERNMQKLLKKIKKPL